MRLVSTTSATALPPPTHSVGSAPSAAQANIWFRTARDTATLCVRRAGRVKTVYALVFLTVSPPTITKTLYVSIAQFAVHLSMRFLLALQPHGNHPRTPYAPTALSAKRMSTFGATAAEQQTQCAGRALSVDGDTMQPPTAPSSQTLCASHARSARMGLPTGRLGAWANTHSR